MKAKLISMMFGLILFANTQISAQKRVIVEAVNEDISYYLDLKAVSYIFGKSANLEDFEQKLNQNDNNISNLDLNGDGYIDYLRVIEVSENKVHLVVIQAILDNDVYQDVATIAVGRNSFNRLNIQVIGDPYLYGNNYIIEPYYYHTPSIVSWFWSPYYTRWHSPYYWGHYPRYYSYHRPLEINIYLSHVSNRYHNNNIRYRYTDNYRYNNYNHIRNSVSRNDYSRNYPERNFSRRNSDYTNKSELQSSRERSSGLNENNRTGSRINSGTRENPGVNNSRGYDNSRINSGSRSSNNTSVDNNSRTNNSRVNSERTDYQTGRSSAERNNNMNSRSNEVSRPTTRTNSEYQSRTPVDVTPNNRENNQTRNSTMTERATNRSEPIIREQKAEQRNTNSSRNSDNSNVQAPRRATFKISRKSAFKVK